MKENFDPSDQLRRYVNGRATEAEKQLIEQWYQALPQGSLDVDDNIIEQDLQQVLDRLRKERSRKERKYLWTKVAAAILVLFIALALYRHYGTKTHTASLPQLVSSDIGPALQRATLTLSDGTVVGLDTVSSGQLTRQLGTGISVSGDGLLTYQPEKNTAHYGSDAINTVTTPRGGFYRVILPDGSSVWINAASSLSFPVRFTASERRVKLHGEAYFEVTRDKTKPFIVESGLQQIRVLGTGFNCRNYSDGPAVTTLVHGKVQVSDQLSKVTMLAPGGQAITSTSGTVRNNVDTEAYIGWRSNLFIFHNSSLKDIMKEIDRWYDVQTDIASLPDEVFYAEIPRDMQLSEALSMLEKTSNVRFKIEGRRIMIR